MKTTLQVIAGFLVVTILVVGLMMWSTGMEIFGLRLGKYVENEKTGVMRQTNQYRTTQETGLANKLAAWNDAETQAALVKDDPEAVAVIRAQQMAIVRDMKRVVNSGTIDKDNIPADVQEFLATH